MKTPTSSFSWGRVARLYQFNAPWIRKQTSIYFLFSFAASMLYLLIPSQTVRMNVYGTCSTVLMLMFIWAPIVFTQGGDTRIIDKLIPVSPVEKFVFYISYLLVVIGLACYFCPWMAERIYHVFYPGEEGGVEAIRTALDIPGIYECSQFLSTIAAMMTCFYCVVAVKRDRIMKAYLISISVSILTSLLNMFYGIKESILWGFKAGEGLESRANESEIVDMVYTAMSDHIGFLFFCNIVSFAYILLLMWLSYRSLYRRNL